ncbi:4-hydroxyphenylpyruvate dioxygenase-like protein [Saccostrea echinata]|uniref:4-hydroxyphenylpyruvate dioxygenase-like protein n=1 Tax=Saccostrea echinata TaxID=191078 RepID=UPI002A828F28|nr:4-hydroxyphenylpyruvate dioxygenase-like protein [Saccostrea echinata]
MEAGSLHHIEFGVSDGESFVNSFKRKFGFHCMAYRSRRYCKQWVLKAGKATLLVTEPDSRCHLENTSTENVRKVTANDPLFNCWWTLESNKVYDKDSVFNVALKVTDLKQVINNVVKGGGEVIASPQSLKDEHGKVDIAVVKSCVGNVYHTLLSYNEYSGDFLPGFNPPENNLIEVNVNYNGLVTHIDHIAFVCEQGSTPHVLQWYEECFSMKRFFINSNEDEDEGFLISDTGIGMRMKAMEYWRCSETGLTSGRSQDSIRFVLVESLKGQGANQVDIFLEDHGGPGVQHVGLYTPDIMTAVSTFKESGVQFVEPPPAYYTDDIKLSEIKKVRFHVEDLRSNGVLLDTEADADQELENHCETNRYLLQKFTKPIFSKRTFFLELIQRVGAQGFGAGNITALWRAVQAYMTENSSS